MLLDDVDKIADESTDSS